MCNNLRDNIAVEPAMVSMVSLVSMLTMTQTRIYLMVAHELTLNWPIHILNSTLNDQFTFYPLKRAIARDGTLSPKH